MGRHNELQRAVRIVRGDPLRRPSPEDLDAFEARTGFRLPDSYREFARTFGGGALGGSAYLIAMPGFGDADERADLDGLNRWVRESAGMDSRDDTDLSTTYADPVRARRLVPFCISAHPHYFGWDPQEVTDPDAHEYAVYALLHGYTNVDKAADSFEGFITGVCVRHELERWRDAGSPMLPAGAFESWQAVESPELPADDDDDEAEEDEDDEEDIEDLLIPFTPTATPA